MDWSYSNNTLWKRVYEYLDIHDTPNHRFVDITFSTGLIYSTEAIMPSGCFYPTIKLIFKNEPFGTQTEQHFW